MQRLQSDHANLRGVCLQVALFLQPADNYMVQP